VDDPAGDAEPAALLVLAEEPREDAAASVRYLLEEGITIKVLSGGAGTCLDVTTGLRQVPMPASVPRG
jgi:predicted polyphosphate/ATP-dependent NAD kinase